MVRRQRLFSCPIVDRSRTFSTTPSGGRAMRAPTQLRKTVIKKTSFPLPSQFPVFLFCTAKRRRYQYTRRKVRELKDAGRNLLGGEPLLPSRSGGFSGKLTRIGLRRPLEMTYRGNALKARNDILRKRANRAKQQCISVLTCRGLHCKPAVPTLFSCPSVDRSETFRASTADAQCAPLRRQ